jgi:hypothetical protein
MNRLKEKDRTIAFDQRCREPSRAWRVHVVSGRGDERVGQEENHHSGNTKPNDSFTREPALHSIPSYSTGPAPLRNAITIAPKVRRPNLALLICFGGAATALLGLAWDISIHSSYPSLAVHETPLDPLSPAHDLIAAGILVSAASAAWAIGKSVNRWLGALALVPVLASMGWIAATAMDAPTLPTGTADQQAAANSLWQKTQTATVRYESLANARADGYVAFNPISASLVHYVKPEYMQDGRILDPQYVESLVYENTLRGPVLVAAMYSLEDPNAAPPDVAGQLTPWHRHDDLCFTPTGEVVGAAPSCPPGSATYFTPWMLHVWLVPNRYGRFAADLDPWSELEIELFG